MRTKKSTLNDVSALLREHAESLLLVLALALIVRLVVVSSYLVRSDSLFPTALAGDVVLGARLPFGIFLPGWGKIMDGRSPRRGELAVFECPGGKGLCLKRIVAIPGDRIEMIHQRLLVNGQACTYKSGGENWIYEDCLGKQRKIGISSDWGAESWGPVVVEPGKVYVLSDNRPEKDDSRTWGMVSEDQLKSVAVRVILSLDWSASSSLDLVRWARTFKSLN